MIAHKLVRYIDMQPSHPINYISANVLRQDCHSRQQERRTNSNFHNSNEASVDCIARSSLASRYPSIGLAGSNPIRRIGFENISFDLMLDIVLNLHF